MRLFVALELPAEVRDALPEPAPPWRAIAREKLHVTVAFLGSVPAAEPVADALAGVDVADAPLCTAGTLMLPPRRPRVLAVGLADPTGAWTRLQATVVAALGELLEQERRPWRPHITIGRARERVPRGAELPEVSALEFIPTSMALFESRGGRYTALARFRH